MFLEKKVKEYLENNLVSLKQQFTIRKPISPYLKLDKAVDKVIQKILQARFANLLQCKNSIFKFGSKSNFESKSQKEELDAEITEVVTYKK